MKFVFRWIGLFLITTWAALAAAQPDPGGGGAGGAQTASADYRLGPGDQIRVQVYQNPDLTVETRVSEQGTINYPLIGNVQLGGTTIGDAEKKIASALKSGNFLRQPQVNIVLLQVRGNQVSVLGQVQKPGRFPLETTNTRVSDLLAAAGGVTPMGDDTLIVTGTRSGQPFRKVIDIPALFLNQRGQDDILVQGGDTLFVNKAPVYYIYGEAQKPGPYRIERGMTVQQAIAQGGGPTPRGSLNRLKVTRTTPDGKKVEADARLSDPVMPNDVIFVRESLF
ncbi:polysaccharide export protein EpsE [Ramlibacter algicola]|jgi:polysaccharide biosynthesis/export protein|uniref:Polysaccharide export protein EpsE n=1 Tax=Ramlibacter algicola TaxID=2795217 RepID=A0A934Q0X6_9BURK|nr:polysaccharide export protein EpsE [Ramlibacter algicola]MBK0392249.1 polysaccharide export protein EpsE [Ramlibacter algicola]